MFNDASHLVSHLDGIVRPLLLQLQLHPPSSVIRKINAGDDD